MPSTRKQKAKEKRSRHSDAMSDIENLDVMLGNYTNSENRDQEAIDQIEIDPESGRRQQDLDQNESNYRSLLNTNLSEKSEITVETSRMISSEISSQMSRKIEEIKSDLNSHILEVINSAIEETILPSIENEITSNREAKNTKWDLRSDGRHPDRNIQMTQNSDLESHGRHKSKFCQQVQDSGENFPKLIATSSNQNNHRRENLVDFEQSDDEGYDTGYYFTWNESCNIKSRCNLFVISQQIFSLTKLKPVHEYHFLDDTLETEFHVTKNSNPSFISSLRHGDSFIYKGDSFIYIIVLYYERVQDNAFHWTKQGIS